MALKAAVFDLDGTLNTIVDLAWATNYALEQFNILTYTVDEVRQMVGNGVAKLIRDAVPEEPMIPARTRVALEHYADHSLDNLLRPTLVSLMRLIRSGRLTLSVPLFPTSPDFAIADLINFFPGGFDFALGPAR